MCTFGIFLAAILVTIHTVFNLYLGNVKKFEDEGLKMWLNRQEVLANVVDAAEGCFFRFLSYCLS